MNGIELMSKINKNNSKIKMVVLSGYDKFEYAKQSIEYGVYSYILKPTKDNEIIEVFMKLKNELDQIHKKAAEYKSLKMRFNEISNNNSQEFIKNVKNSNNRENNRCSHENMYNKLTQNKSDDINAVNSSDINFNDINSNETNSTGTNNFDIDPLIEKVKRYMSLHYNEKITLEALAEIVYMNPSYFSLYFKQKTGINYIEYLTMLRIQEAKTLLKNTDMKLYEIAGKVGYDDFRYFSRLFKKTTGINAQQYRKSPIQNDEVQKEELCFY
jgi:two-component system response regulator YesN